MGPTPTLGADGIELASPVGPTLFVGRPLRINVPSPDHQRELAGLVGWQPMPSFPGLLGLGQGQPSSISVHHRRTAFHPAVAVLARIPRSRRLQCHSWPAPVGGVVILQPPRVLCHGVEGLSIVFPSSSSLPIPVFRSLFLWPLATDYLPAHLVAQDPIKPNSAFGCSSRIFVPFFSFPPDLFSFLSIGQSSADSCIHPCPQTRLASCTGWIVSLTGATARPAPFTELKWGRR